VIRFEKEGGYNPEEIFRNDLDVRKVLMQLINGFYSPEDAGTFRELFDALVNTKTTDRADRFFILKDFRSYMEAQKELNRCTVIKTVGQKRQFLMCVIPQNSVLIEQ
jgi:starch phosphorylase